MTNPNRFTMQPETLQVSRTDTGAGTGATPRNSETARAIEVWINVSAISGVGATLTLNIETTENGTDFFQAKQITGVTATGAKAVVLNRADSPLGKTIRVTWTIAGTTPSVTFEVKMLRME